jgi:hypothetical protein
MGDAEPKDPFAELLQKGSQAVQQRQPDAAIPLLEQASNCNPTPLMPIFGWALLTPSPNAGKTPPVIWNTLAPSIPKCPLFGSTWVSFTGGCNGWAKPLIALKRRCS